MWAASAYDSRSASPGVGYSSAPLHGHTVSLGSAVPSPSPSPPVSRSASIGYGQYAADPAADTLVDWAVPSRRTGEIRGLDAIRQAMMDAERAVRARETTRDTVNQEQDVRQGIVSQEAATRSGLVSSCRARALELLQQLEESKRLAVTRSEREARLALVSASNERLAALTQQRRDRLAFEESARKAIVDGLFREEREARAALKWRVAAGERAARRAEFERHAGAARSQLEAQRERELFEGLIAAFRASSVAAATKQMVREHREARCDVEGIESTARLARRQEERAAFHTIQRCAFEGREEVMRAAFRNGFTFARAQLQVTERSNRMHVQHWLQRSAFESNDEGVARQNLLHAEARLRFEDLDEAARRGLIEVRATRVEIHQLRREEWTQRQSLWFGASTAAVVSTETKQRSDDITGREQHAWAALMYDEKIQRLIVTESDRRSALSAAASRDFGTLMRVTFVRELHSVQRGDFVMAELRARNEALVNAEAAARRRINHAEALHHVEVRETEGRHAISGSWVTLTRTLSMSRGTEQHTLERREMESVEGLSRAQVSTQLLASFTALHHEATRARCETEEVERRDRSTATERAAWRGLLQAEQSARFSVQRAQIELSNEAPARNLVVQQYTEQLLRMKQAEQRGWAEATETEARRRVTSTVAHSAWMELLHDEQTARFGVQRGNLELAAEAPARLLIAQQSAQLLQSLHNAERRAAFELDEADSRNTNVLRRQDSARQQLIRDERSQRHQVERNDFSTVEGESRCQLVSNVQAAWSSLQASELSTRTELLEREAADNLRRRLDMVESTEKRERDVAFVGWWTQLYGTMLLLRETEERETLLRAALVDPQRPDAESSLRAALVASARHGAVAIWTRELQETTEQRLHAATVDETMGRGTLWATWRDDLFRMRADEVDARERLRRRTIEDEAELAARQTIVDAALTQRKAIWTKESAQRLRRNLNTVEADETTARSQLQAERLTRFIADDICMPALVERESIRRAVLTRDIFNQLFIAAHSARAKAMALFEAERRRGVHTAEATSRQLIAKDYAAALAAIKNRLRLEKLERNARQFGKPFIGLQLAEKQTHFSRGKDPEPLYIDALYKGGPAYMKGLRLKDELLKIGGVDVTSLAHVRHVLAKTTNVGATVEVIVRRASYGLETIGGSFVGVGDGDP
jgi:hypothetical protein